MTTECDERRVVCWDESYKRRENFIFEAKDEVIRFLSRYVRKRVGPDEFEDKLPAIDGRRRLKILDYGCGIGSQTFYVANKLKLDAVGVDISKEAIAIAETLLRGPEQGLSQFYVLYPGWERSQAEFEYDVTICDCVLDSMAFNLAKEAINNLARITRKYIFFSVISGHELGDSANADEFVVDHAHEYGTVQSYYDTHKINMLVQETGFFISSMQLQTYHNLTLSDEAYELNHLLSNTIKVHGRYFVLIERK